MTFSLFKAATRKFSHTTRKHNVLCCIHNANSVSHSNASSRCVNKSYNDNYNRNNSICCYFTRSYQTTNSAVHNSSSNTKESHDIKSKSPLYTIAKITNQGKIQYTSLSISDILRGSSMNARDLFSLALTSSEEENTKKRYKRRPPAVILPRTKEIIMSFGYVRALIGTDSAMIFDAHKPTTQILVNDLRHVLLTTMETSNSNSNQIGGENSSRLNNENIHSGNDPFEIVFIELILRDVCNTFNCRLSLYEPIVDSLLSRVSNEVYSEFSTLPIIKDSLQEFEMHVKSALKSLKHLLENDEDMLGLLLTEQMAAKKRGEVLSNQHHESVELLFEEYSRQLNNTLEEIYYLLRRVQSKQELVAISLDAYRNSMIQMNVYLAISGIGLGAGTTVAGFYGMNLIHGLENSPSAFSNVVGFTSFLGVLIFAGCSSYLSGPIMRRRVMQRQDELGVISRALSDMNALDYATKFVKNSDEPLNKDQFKEKIMEYQQCSNFSNAEVNFLFNMLDISNNGLLHHDDFRSMEDIRVEPGNSKINKK